MPFTYRIGWPDGSWIMRNEIASSVETAEWSFTGIRTRLRRRLPDHRDAGMGTRLSTRTESESGLIGSCRKGNKTGPFRFELRLGQWCAAVHNAALASSKQEG